MEKRTVEMLLKAMQGPLLMVDPIHTWLVENHHKKILHSKPTRAAHYKRLAKKRQNVRARAKK